MLPFNPRQELPSNRIPNETHSLSPAGSVPFRLIVPTHSPFFRTDLVVKNGSKLLKEGVDFYLTHKFLTGTHITAKPIHGSIYIVNEALAGNITVSYDTLGGDYLIGSNTKPSQAVDPTSKLWEDIVGDLPFPPVHILFDIEKDEWQGEAEHNASVRALADAIEGRDPSEQELHNWLLDRILRLEAIYNDAQAVAHIANKNNPHSSTAWQTRSLDKTANARDTAEAFGRDLQELAAYINNLNLPASELNKYVKLASANTMSGSIQYRNGQFSLLSKDGRAGIYFSDDSANLIATNDIIMEAGSDGTGNFELCVGNQKLTVGSSTPAKFNNIEIATVANSADLGEDQIDRDRLKVQTADTETLRWSGDGSAANPLVATIITTDASDADFGVTKLATKSLTLNDETLAATPWHVNELGNIFSGKVDADVKVNGKLLAINPILRKGDAEIGLGNVQNVSDEDMPAGSANRVLLEDKSTVEHGHDLSEVDLPDATETVKGIGLISPDIEENVKDRAIDRGVEETLTEALEAAKIRSGNLFPVGVLKIDAYGDNTYLPAPVTGSFNNPSSYWNSMPVIREANYLTMLRLGRDNDSSGLMLSYTETSALGKMTTMINTVHEYRPGFMAFEDQITGVVGGSEEYFIFRVWTPSTNLTRHFVAKTNKTMDITKHTFVEIDIAVWGLSQFQCMTHEGETIYLCNPDSNQFLQVTIPAAYWENGQGAIKPIMTDLRALVSGLNNNGDEIRDRGFISNSVTHSAGNNAAVLDLHSQYSSISHYGPSAAVFAENGILYIKSGRDYALRGGLHPNRTVGLTWYATINLTTLEAAFVPGTRTRITIDANGIPDHDGQGQWRRDAFGSRVSGSASNNRSATVLAGGSQYNFINHVAEMFINEVNLVGGGGGVSYFDPLNESIETSGQVTLVVEGATYDGYRKPFYGLAHGPVVGGKQTIMARGDNDSKIYYGDTLGWSPEGYLPTGFRKKLTGTEFMGAGWGQIPYCKESGGRQTGDISYLYCSNYGKLYGQPTANDAGDITLGKEYVASTSERNTLREKFRVLVAAKHGKTLKDLYFTCHYSPASKFRCAFVCAISTDGDLYYDAYVVDKGLLIPNADGTLSVNVSGNFTNIYTETIAAAGGRNYTSITFTTCRVQSFISEWANGDSVLMMPSTFHGYSPSSASSTGRALYITIDGGADASDDTQFKTRVVGHPIWGYGSYFQCDWGRPFRVDYDDAQIGLIAKDIQPTFNEVVNGDKSSTNVPKQRVFNMLHDESWNVSFYAEKRLILNGTEYLMPVANYDLSTLPTYRNTLLYIFAELVDDVTVYNFYETPSSPNEGVRIGTVKTSNVQVEKISIDYSVSLGMFRELERHIADYDDPHGILGSGAEDIGLGNLSNLPLKHELTSVDFSEIFNDWYRFSHAEAGGFPANSGELASWVYVAATDTIYTPLNSATYIGFVSEIGYGDYSFETVVGTYTTNGDNDAMTVVLAFKVDENGKEHTLSVIRAGSKEGHLFPSGNGSTFSIWYNYKQADQKQLVGTEATNAEDTGGWGLRECTVKATRSGADWVVTSTPISAQSNPSKVEHTLTLIGASYPELAIFNGAVRIGYGCLSQPQSSFKNLRRPDTDIFASYASREMAQGIMDDAPTAPLVIKGTVNVGQAIPYPVGYTTGQCTVIPIISKLANAAGITGWEVGAHSGVAKHLTFGSSGDATNPTMDYLLYCQK